MHLGGNTQKLIDRVDPALREPLYQSLLRTEPLDQRRR
jgi:hypothetical protein